MKWFHTQEVVFRFFIVRPVIETPECEGALAETSRSIISISKDFASVSGELGGELGSEERILRDVGSVE
jgi:hypothetical protein